MPADRDRSVSVHFARLRKILPEHGWTIGAPVVIGRGFRLERV
jgi:hypothetical protein